MGISYGSLSKLPPSAGVDLTALQNDIAALQGTQSTISGNLNALTTQVGALAPENVIENGEFTAQAILDLVKTVDGTGSGLDADSLGGQTLAAIQTLIDAKAAETHTHAAGDITGLSSGITLGGEQSTGWWQKGTIGWAISHAMTKVPAGCVVTRTAEDSSNNRALVYYRSVIG